MEIPDGHKIINEGRARIPYPANEEGDVPVRNFDFHIDNYMIFFF